MEFLVTTVTATSTLSAPRVTVCIVTVDIWVSRPSINSRHLNVARGSPAEGAGFGGERSERFALCFVTVTVEDVIKKPGPFSDCWSDWQAHIHHSFLIPD